MADDGVYQGIYGIAEEANLGFARWRDAPSCVTGLGKSVAILFAGTNDGSLMA
jgi:hypothetical protein